MINFTKIIIFISLIIVYLGLSKALSPTGLNINYVFNQESLSSIIKEKPVSLILIDTHSTGFAIKTHYHKYRAVYGFKSYQELIVKVSSNFRDKHAKHIGASIFRRSINDKESFIPLIPGAIFLNDKTFGTWYKGENNQKIWKFYRVYRHLTDFLGWQEYAPTYKDYQKIQIALNQNTSFFGPKNQFGTKGTITKKSFKNYFKRQRPNNINFKSFLQEYFKENFYKSKVSL